MNGALFEEQLNSEQRRMRDEVLLFILTAGPCGGEPEW